MRSLPKLVEIAVDTNLTVVLLAAIPELGAFLNREAAAAGDLPVTGPVGIAARRAGQHLTAPTTARP